MQNGQWEMSINVSIAFASFLKLFVQRLEILFFIRGKVWGSHSEIQHLQCQIRKCLFLFTLIPLGLIVGTFIKQAIFVLFHLHLFSVFDFGMGSKAT